MDDNKTGPLPEMPENGSEPAEIEKAGKKVRNRERGVKEYQRLILRIVAFVFVLWLLLFVFLGFTTAPNDDMDPNIRSGDMVLFYRLDKTPKAQDVVVFKKTDSSGRKLTLVGRVVAVAGDVVEITEEGVLLINGNAVSETNIYDKTTMPLDAKSSPEYPLTLGKDECFVLGDKRSEATDSRIFGPVKKSEIMGTVIMIIRKNNI